MALEEYQRKRRFAETPEPPPRVGKRDQHRFVVQKHRASHLHFDFRLEMDGVLKSWAVPKGPSLDAADKRLAMMVEDHPVSYFDFEGIIPPGNYGAGTVQVWDVGTWEPLPPQPAQNRRGSGTPALGDPHQMMEKGDFKFRLNGKKLKGEFVLARMRSRRPGSKGTEWLLIKKRDRYVKEGFDANSPKLDSSVLTKRSLEQIAKDAGSAEWESNRKTAPARGKTDWLSKSIAIADKKKMKTTEDAEDAEERSSLTSTTSPTKGTLTSRSRSNIKTTNKKDSAASRFPSREELKEKKKRKKISASSASSVVLVSSDPAKIPGARKAEMPRVIYPMLATLVDEPFSSDEWLFEIKWDGYRAVAFIDKGKVRLVSRNQNEFTGDFPELQEIATRAKAMQAVIDGEIVALDEQGRPSFSLMQQRSGLTIGPKRRGRDKSIPIVYYAFDLLFADGYDLTRVDLEKRKELLKSLLDPSELVRYSDHILGQGEELYRAAREQKLEGIVAKKRNGRYIQKRSREWLKMKVTMEQECVIGGYTDPRGSREHFGSIVLGLYDEEGRLIPVGQAGSGFTYQTHEALWKKLKPLETPKSPFAFMPESPRKLHYLGPKLVAQIKFAEWTHEGQSGAVKMRAPVFLGLREDKNPRECRFEMPKSAKKEVLQMERKSPKKNVA
jgi:bifunctional non-homologous end joining protein LigD